MQHLATTERICATVRNARKTAYVRAVDDVFFSGGVLQQQQQQQDPRTYAFLPIRNEIVALHAAPFCTKQSGLFRMEWSSFLTNGKRSLYCVARDLGIQYSHRTATKYVHYLRHPSDIRPIHIWQRYSSKQWCADVQESTIGCIGLHPPVANFVCRGPKSDTIYRRFAGAKAPSLFALAVYCLYLVVSSPTVKKSAGRFVGKTLVIVQISDRNGRVPRL